MYVINEYRDYDIGWKWKEASLGFDLRGKK